MKRIHGGAVSIGVLAVIIAANGPLAAQGNDARITFGMLKDVACAGDEVRPRTNEEWTALLSRRGLKQMPSSGDKGLPPMWSLSTGDGETRATAFFRADETSYFLLFFPKSAEAPPPAVTEWLLGQPSPRLTEGDVLEISLPTRNACGEATSGDVVTMSLSTGQLIRFSFAAHWKRRGAGS